MKDSVFATARNSWHSFFLNAEMPLPREPSPSPYVALLKYSALSKNVTFRYLPTFALLERNGALKL